MPKENILLDTVRKQLVLFSLGEQETAAMFHIMPLREAWS